LVIFLTFSTPIFAAPLVFYVHLGRRLRGIMFFIGERFPILQ